MTTKDLRSGDSIFYNFEILLWPIGPVTHKATISEWSQKKKKSVLQPVQIAVSADLALES